MKKDVKELHQKVMKAAMDQSITDEEYFKIMESCLDEMDRIGISEQDMRQISTDVANALISLGFWPFKAVV